MSSASQVSTSLLFAVSLSTLIHGWRWPSSSQTARSFSDLLSIKDHSPQTSKGSQQQQNGATNKYLWSSLGARHGSGGGSHVRGRGLDVSSPYSSYGLIHKVIQNPQDASSHLFVIQVLWDTGRRGRTITHLPWGLQHNEVEKVVNCTHFYF